MTIESLVGVGMLTVATVVFIYYTIWTFALPFVDESHFIFNLFPPREWAIKIPVALLLAGSTLVATYISVVLIKSARKEQQKRAAAKAK